MSHAKKDDPENIELVKVLARADRNFDHVIAGARYIRLTSDAEKMPWYPALIAGIVVSYASHFGRSNTLESLPPMFSEFKEHPFLAPLHKQFVMARHWAFAHDSPGQTKGLLKGPESLSYDDVVIENIEGRGVRWRTAYVHWPQSEVVHLEGLATYQKKRVGEEICRLVLEMNGGNPPAPGIHKLGVDFPHTSGPVT